MTVSPRIAMMSLAGGLGSRLYPLTAKPGVPAQDMRKRSLNLGSVNINAMPKPLAPLTGVPLMLPLAQRAASSCGVEDIGMALMYMPEDIRQYYGSNMRQLRRGPGASFFWEHQKEHNLDTAGCLVRGWLQDMSANDRGVVRGNSDQYIVVSADIRADADISDMLGAHIEHKSLVSIGLSPVPWTQVGRFGTVMRHGDKYRNGDKNISYRGGKYAPIIGFEEKNPDAKSNLNNASIYIFSRRLFELVHGDVQVEANRNSSAYHNDYTDDQGRHFRLGVFSERLLKTGAIQEGQVNPNFSDWAKHIFADMIVHHPELYAQKTPSDPHGFFGYLLGGLWADDGTLSSLLESNHEVLFERGGFEEAHDFSWWPKKAGYSYLDTNGNRIWMGEGSSISCGATVVGPSYIGDNVIVEEGATIINSVINGAPSGMAWRIGKGACISGSVLWPDRSALGLEMRGDGLKYEVRDMLFENCIVGGGFRKRGKENVFHLDAGGEYSRMASGASSFKNSVIVPSQSNEMVVKGLD
jgi:NDP-sugar pyrophosphorylase family protein